MKYAIYFLAVGDNARDCLEFSYRSLRSAGFENDVYVLCDQDSVSFSISDNTKIIKIKDEHLNLEMDTEKPLAFFDVRKLDKTNPRNVRNPRKWGICRAKTLIDKYISFDSYDYIVYLDIDVLVHGPASDLEDFLLDNPGSIVTAQNQDEQRLGGRGNFSFRKLKRVRTFSAANLSNFELLRFWFKQAICSDIICIPTDFYGKKMLEDWRKEVQKDIDYDQPALQAVLLREYKDSHTLAPHSLFGYGPCHDQHKDTEELQKINSTFVHFGGAIKDDRVFRDYYNHFIKS
jgi:hypothetical protein